MPRDEPLTVAQADGWVEATSEAVASIDLFSVNGARPLLSRFQDTAPSTDDPADGVPWQPGQAEKDMTMPGGATTRLWVRAPWGDTTCYVKHA
ncbi:MAG: hypothetical protein AAF479_10970 [Pseudomonadota bacterium]